MRNKMSQILLIKEAMRVLTELYESYLDPEEPILTLNHDWSKDNYEAGYEVIKTKNGKIGIIKKRKHK